MLKNTLNVFVRKTGILSRFSTKIEPPRHKTGTRIFCGTNKKTPPPFVNNQNGNSQKAGAKWGQRIKNGANKSVWLPGLPNAFSKDSQILMIRQKNRRPPAGGVLQAGGIIACGSYNHSKRPRLMVSSIVIVFYSINTTGNAIDGKPNLIHLIRN